ncbi:MAG: PRC-barrel domain-containing protein [Methanobacteriaceae archaeon]|nr:PRC-barrel domain-containing protein [Candidatus Methanorudis spinitermitis]
MVEISNLYGLNIYTIAGEYVGRVSDVVLNMKLGTVSKFQLKALEPGKKDVSFKEVFKNSFKIVPDDDELRPLQEGLLNVDFDKVKAIGDIMLIDPQDFRKEEPKIEERDVV